MWCWSTGALGPPPEEPPLDVPPLEPPLLDAAPEELPLDPLDPLEPELEPLLDPLPLPLLPPLLCPPELPLPVAPDPEPLELPEDPELPASFELAGIAGWLPQAYKIPSPVTRRGSASSKRNRIFMGYTLNRSMVAEGRIRITPGRPSCDFPSRSRPCRGRSGAQAALMVQMLEGQ